VAKQVQSEEDRIAAEEAEKKSVVVKGHRTPTRKEQEAQRKRPLVGANTPEARAQSKDQQRAQRDRARAGMAAGEEKYLPVRDRGPQKRFIRDFVDSRWSVGELAIPILILYVVATLVVPSVTAIQIYGEYVVLAFLVLVIIDSIVLNTQLRRALGAKFGADRVDRIGLYGAMRAVQLRRMRLPKAQVKRGQRPH
jgi:hypothetical protein